MMNNVKGRLIIQANIALTCVFLLSSFVAAIVFREPFKTIAVVIDLLCFSLGVVVFIWGYFSAVQRSRKDTISVVELYFLVDGVATKKVALVMNSLLGIQLMGGIGTALMRSSTDGQRGSTLAFGILVPMLGLGLNGLWAAHYGNFSSRGGGSSTQMPPLVAPSGKD